MASYDDRNYHEEDRDDYSDPRMKNSSNTKEYDRNEDPRYSTWGKSD